MQPTSSVREGEKKGGILLNEGKGKGGGGLPCGGSPHHKYVSQHLSIHRFRTKEMHTVVERLLNLTVRS